MKRLIAMCATLALSGCGFGGFMYPKVEFQEPAAEPVQPLPVSQPSNGAIFQPAAYRPLFEDHRARVVGDTLTVTIVEKVAASQKSTSSIDKQSTISGNITAVPGVNADKVLGRAAAAANMGNTFGGKGATENTNDFSGTVTVTVRQVLPNGHLVVAGEKQIGVNANVDVLRFSGQVDPRAIQPGNTLQSTQIANVRLEHRGRGAQADSQSVGWLQRVFMSVWSPL